MGSSFAKASEGLGGGVVKIPLVVSLGVNSGTFFSTGLVASGTMRGGAVVSSSLGLGVTVWVGAEEKDKAGVLAAGGGRKSRREKAEILLDWIGGLR